MLFPVILLIYFFASGLAWLFYRKQFVFLSTKYGRFFWLLLTLNFLLPRLLSSVLPYSFIKVLSIMGGLWFFFIYYTLMLGVLQFLIMFLIKIKIKNIKKISRYEVLLRSFGLLVISVCIVVGVNKAFDPVPRYEEVSTEKLTKPLRVVLVSDIHLGTILSKEYCETLVEKINNEKPDIILMAGDIIDDKLEIVMREQSLQPLAKLKAANGVIAVLGNHDYFDRKSEQEVTELNKVGVSVLINQKVKLDQISIVGLKDFSQGESVSTLKDLAVGNGNHYKILLEHQPRHIEVASAEDYDLYLAGHTHAGAFFPNKYFTALMHTLDYGRGAFGSMTAIVTSGYGFFGIPVRLGVNPEYVVLDLQPKGF